MKRRFVNVILWLLAKQGLPSVVPWAFGMIRSLYDNEPGAYRELLEHQSGNDEWIHQFFVAHELGELYREYPDAVLERLRDRSGSDVEIVREGSARSWSRVLEQDFDRGFNQLTDLRENGSYEERYTAALAPVRYIRNATSLPDEHRRKLLQFWHEYEEDPKQGLWNIVRTQILPELEGNDGDQT